MKKLLIVYHSQAGNTEAMARVISEGASSAGATVVMKRAVDATGEDLLACDVVAIGTPNYFSYMSGLVKDFFDRAWPMARGRVKDERLSGSRILPGSMSSHPYIISPSTPT